MAGAYKSIDPKTAMLTIAGKTVTWDTLFYYIYYTVSQIEEEGGQITNWSAAYQDETTYRDYVLATAVKLLLQTAAIDYGAAQQKVALTPKAQSGLQSDWDEQVQNAGSEEAWIAKLQSQYCNKEIFMSLETANYLQQDCFSAMYGDRGSKLSDKDVADYTAEDSYLMAKHILFVTTKVDESGTETNMTDAEKSQVKLKAEGILAQLKEYKGTDFNGLFDQLMKQNTQDPGLASFPSGYLFQSGDMVSAFDDAVKALQVGQFAQNLIETEFGYHIVYRIPVNFDITPMQFSSYGEYPLRFITAVDMFKANVDVWLNSLVITYSDKYKALDFNKMFAQG